MRLPPPVAGPDQTVLPVPGPVHADGRPKTLISGLRYARLLDDELRQLAGHAAHPNRTLAYPHVVLAHLLAFFTPVLTSLRKIEDAFEIPSLRKHVGTPRVPKSTLADAQRLFDPALLLPLIEQLKQRVTACPHDARLDEFTEKLIAVDGTFFAVAPRIAWALFQQTTKADSDRPIRKAHVRGHFHFDIRRGIPDFVTLTDGQAVEADQLKLALQADCFYIIDRGFENYHLLQDILNLNGHFVVRLRKTASLRVEENRPLTAADLAAGVRSDAAVRVGWRENSSPISQTLRCVTVAAENPDDEPLRLLTHRTDLPAALIALIYRHRWQIELFFRWLKCMAGFRHFFSESQQGMTLQIYVALIATLLLAVETGGKPSSYDYALMSLAVGGRASIEECLLVAARRRNRCRRDAARAKQRAAERAAAQKNFH